MKNRCGTHDYFSANPDDTASDAELDYYAARSNGPGMVITACAYFKQTEKVLKDSSPRTEILIPSLRSVASSIKEKGAKAVLQIYHGGRLAVPHLIPDAR